MHLVAFREFASSSRRCCKVHPEISVRFGAKSGKELTSTKKSSCSIGSITAHTDAPPPPDAGGVQKPRPSTLSRAQALNATPAHQATQTQGGGTSSQTENIPP